MSLPSLHPARATASALFLFAALCSAPAQAVVQLDDRLTDNGDRDYRSGQVLPSTLQLQRVRDLQASAQWNRFGTIRTLLRQGDFLGSGYSGTPETGARAWVMDNRELFRLSPASVQDLELVNAAEMPYTDARAVLFRQSFGGLKPTSEGLISVGIVNGRVYYASSSSAGDQPLPGAAVLSPLQAWLKAAADVNRYVKSSDVLANRDLTAKNGWHLFKVLSFSEEQRARLIAVPMPAGGVRQAYETIVLDNQRGAALAVVHWIDAETGAILRRENHVYYQTGGTPLPQTYSGSFPAVGQCDVRHDFAVAAGNVALHVTLAGVSPENAVSLKLYYTDAAGNSKLVATPPQTTGPLEVLNYVPQGGVPQGSYQVEACAEETFVSLPPYNYVGTFTASPVDTSVTSPVFGASTSAPVWKWFPATPTVDFAGTDIRKLLCFAALPEPGYGGCDIDVTSIASRAPWDTLLGGVIPTFTTVGNNAITAGDSLSPLTPSVPNLSFSPTRRYDYAFNNAWYSSGCSPAGILESQVPNSNGNDLAAVMANLFVSHNRMHDFSYFLGFTERNYNLQMYNFGLTPVTQQNDWEQGQAQAGAIGGSPASPTFGTLPGRDNANQIALMDGIPGITNQYLFQAVGGVIYPPCSDGSLDMGIVGHEYTHAISNRMVAGPDGGLTGAQSGSMGESWSDLNATEFQLAYGYLPQEGFRATALAAYTTGNLERGIRNYPLDDSPLNYGNLGFDTPGPEVHSDGEIWNAVQWELRQAFVDHYQAQFDYNDRTLQKACADGKRAPETCPGNRWWIQLVYDAWLLLPGEISMLNARDAMLAADLARFGGAHQELMWRVFAHRGMGAFAYATDTEDVVPVPNFESPLASDHAEVTFKVVAGDEANSPIAANILVGRYATRTRPIADTDPATVYLEVGDSSDWAYLNLRDTARMVPAAYEFMVVAPGYGIHHFEQELKPGANTLTFTLPTNWASATKGAEATVTATGVEDAQAQMVNSAAGYTAPPVDAALLIDDSEDTGTLIGDGGNVAGSYAIITLAGGEHTLAAANISMSAGPSNAGRWGAVRSFELRACSGACTDPEGDFQNVAYTSAEDAFPGGIPRPLQPDLRIRSFSFPPVQATHVQFRVLTTQCSGGPLYQGDHDGDPTVNPDCMTARPLISGLNAIDSAPIIGPAPGSYARGTDIQLFSSEPKLAVEQSGGSKLARFGGALPFSLLLPLLLAGLRRRRS